MDNFTDSPKISRTQTVGHTALRDLVRVHVVFVVVMMVVTFVGAVVLQLRTRKKRKGMDTRRTATVRLLRPRAGHVHEPPSHPADLQTVDEARAVKDVKKRAGAKQKVERAAVSDVSALPEVDDGAETDEDEEVERFLVEVHRPFTARATGGHSSSYDAGQRMCDSKSELGSSSSSHSLTTHPGLGIRSPKESQSSDAVDSKEAEQWSARSRQEAARTDSCPSRRLRDLLMGDDSQETGADLSTDTSSDSLGPETDDSHYSEIQDALLNRSWTERLRQQRRQMSLSDGKPKGKNGYQKLRPLSASHVFGLTGNSTFTDRNGISSKFAASDESYLDCRSLCHRTLMSEGSPGMENQICGAAVKSDFFQFSEDDNNSDHYSEVDRSYTAALSVDDLRSESPAATVAMTTRRESPYHSYIEVMDDSDVSITDTEGSQSRVGGGSREVRGHEVGGDEHHWRLRNDGKYCNSDILDDPNDDGEDEDDSTSASDVMSTSRCAPVVIAQPGDDMEGENATEGRCGEDCCDVTCRAQREDSTGKHHTTGTHCGSHTAENTLWETGNDENRHEYRNVSSAFSDTDSRRSSLATSEHEDQQRDPSSRQLRGSGLMDVQNDSDDNTSYLNVGEDKAVVDGDSPATVPASMQSTCNDFMSASGTKSLIY